MSKIRIDIDAIVVESFPTEEAESERGTVRGHDSVAESSFFCSANDAQTCARRRTDYASCQVDCECTNRYERCLWE